MINLKKLEESIVLITSAKRANVIGTGFTFYREKNYIYLLTCAHVVEDMGGEENVRVNNIPVELVEIGNAQGFDLAVLKVKDIFPVPPLKLMILYGEQERSFEIKIPGYYLWGQNNARRRRTIKGKMMVEVDGERAFQIIEYMPEEVAVGKLQIEQGKLQPGYSGAPVIDLNTGFVVGITTHMEGENQNLGKFGTAISIEALEKIWREIPTEVSQEIIRESLESSENLSVEETPVEPLESYENLPVEETPVETVENSKDLSIEETPVEPVENSEDLSIEETPVEPVENSKDLSIEETPVEPVENSEDLSIEETPVEPVENSEDLSIEETPVEPVENSEDLSIEETPVEPVENSED
ncbi:trypsin-like peptidase domain-containing protein, partial [Dapis sp. BLCC M229]|uniref:trypsin-like peptidase domain-containing protein n=1 Tax=Dapis sp. BLCC M229 TaxID=3400188 RepID=UPI003CE99204